MKKPFAKILGIFFTCFVGLNLTIAQEEIPTNQSYFQEFQGTKSAEDRFKFFFNTANRYNQNSGFDWLDEVNVYLNG